MGGLHDPARMLGRRKPHLRREPEMTDEVDDGVIPPEEVAYHEAGHAVAAGFFYQTMIYVAILAGGYSGRPLPYWEPSPSIFRAGRDWDCGNPPLISLI